jgi:hypothetical protein
VAGSGRKDPTEEYLKELDLLRVRRGSGVLDDIPEAVVPFVARHLLAQPWSYWRYPLGAHRRWERRLYEREPTGPPPPAADPELQIKAPPGAGAGPAAPAASAGVRPAGRGAASPAAPPGEEPE